MSENNKIYRFTIFGSAVPERSQSAIVGGVNVPRRVQTFRTSKTRDWARTVQVQALQFKPPEPLQGEVELHCCFILPRPKSAPKTKFKPHIGRPDLTQLYKVVEDGLRGIFYLDDAQIIGYGYCDGETRQKRYASPGEPVRVKIEVWNRPA
mgnify:CR=1 FL=1